MPKTRSSAPRGSRRRNLTLRRLALVGVVTGSLVGGGTAAWAYWSVQSTMTGRSLGSGTLDMTVSGTNGDLRGPGGTAALPGLTLTDAVPGASSAAGFTIHNSGTATFTPSVTGSAAAPLTSWLTTTVRYGATSTGTACTGGTVAAPTLAPGASVPTCVVVTLDTGAPAAVQGTTATVTLALTATQVP